jgi:tetratricopeptide (TPR) repeat protein
VAHLEKARQEGKRAAADEDYRHASEDFAEACKRNPTLPWPHVNLGLLYYERKDVVGPAQALSGAIREFKAAINIDPKEASHHTHLGSAYLALFDLQKKKADLPAARDSLRAASDSYTQAIALAAKPKRDPYELCKAYRGRGNVKMAREEPESAIEDYDKAIASWPADKYSHLGRGRAYLATDSLKQAESDFTYVINNVERCPAAYQGRSEVYHRQGKTKEADADVREAENLRGAPGGR